MSKKPRWHVRALLDAALPLTGSVAAECLGVAEFRILRFPIPPKKAKKIDMSAHAADMHAKLVALKAKAADADADHWRQQAQWACYHLPLWYESEQ